jgi:hypothetical protein
LRKLALLALPALLAPMAVFATSTAARADITTSCYNDICQVYESMGSDGCTATVWQSNSSGYEDSSGTFAETWYVDDQSGYTCHFWFERDVNDTGWYQVGSTTALGSTPNVANSTQTGPFYDGGSYQARVCFQFDWGSSLGATHCSGAVSYEG